MGNGGYIHIWLKDKPDEKDMKLLKGYYDTVSKRVKGLFWLDFEKPKIDWIEKIQIWWKIGYVPKIDVVIIGGLDCIFLATEAILRRFEGYTTCGITQKERDKYNIPGKILTIYSISFEFTWPEISKRYLTNVEIFSAYFNSQESEETKKLYSFPDE